VSTARLVLHQYRYDQRVFWRDPAAVFFTVALPLIFLFIFVSIFGNQPTAVEGREISGATYYVPGIVTLAVESATFLGLAISLVAAREQGILKRVRSTPLPPWVFMAGRICTSIAVSALLVVVVAGIGRLVYGVELPLATLPGLLVTLVVGVAALCALGFAATALIPTENAAPAVTNAIALPLLFISGIFIPTEALPEAMQAVAAFFPLKPLFDGFLAAFDPATVGPGIVWGDMAVLAAWGLAGLVVATRTFRWTPRAD
jgi:ABC-2 type transport system permease protein